MAYINGGDPNYLLTRMILQVALTSNPIWVFPKIGVPQNGWFIMEIPFKMDDLRVPPF